MPGWTHLQKSIFAARWASQNPQDVGFIILFSWQCRTLLRLSSPRSARILDKKIREIVTAVRQDKFDEYYTEWCVLDMLACREKAIGLEPFAGEEADRGTPPLASPDCLVCTGKGDFCIEVTLCRFSRLNRGATHQKEVIAQFMAAAELYFSTTGQSYAQLPRHISFALPSDLENTRALEEVMVGVVRQVFTANQGELRTQIASCQKPVPVTWELVRDPVEFAKIWHGRFPSVNNFVRKADGSVSDTPQIPICWVEVNFDANDLENLVVETMKRVRAQKSKQFKTAKPTFLVMRVEQPILAPLRILEVLSKRIWANDQFRCLSGLLIHVPRNRFTNDGHAPYLIQSLNPKADFPVSKGFLEEEFCGPLPRYKF